MADLNNLQFRTLQWEYLHHHHHHSLEGDRICDEKLKFKQNVCVMKLHKVSEGWYSSPRTGNKHSPVRLSNGLLTQSVPTASSCYELWSPIIFWHQSLLRITHTPTGLHHFFRTFLPICPNNPKNVETIAPKEGETPLKMCLRPSILRRRTDEGVGEI